MTHRSLYWSIVAAWAWVGATVACSEPVVVIKDKDITPYNQAITGLKESCQAAVKEVDLDRAQQEGADAVATIKSAAPSVLVTLGRKSSQVAAASFPDLPTVVCMDPDPSGIKGKKNMAFIPLSVPPVEQFKAVAAVVKKAKRIGVVYSMSELDAIVTEGKKDAASLGMTLTSQKVTKAEDMPAALKDMIQSIDLVWVLPDQDIINKESVRTLILISVDYQMPLLVYSTDFVRSGALLAVIHDYPDTGRKAGAMAKSCLDGLGGQSLGDLKVPYPSTQWAINVNMAQRLNILVTDDVKSRKPEPLFIE